MKRNLMFAGLLMVATLVSAQTEKKFQFRYDERKLDVTEINDDLYNGHFMGDRIGKKMLLLSQQYTYKEDPTPTNPTATTVVEKPDIYYNVKKLERYYKKAIKKGTISEEDAINQFEKIIDIALLVRHQKTEEFEQYLKTIKGEEKIVGVFSSEVEISYY